MSHGVHAVQHEVEHRIEHEKHGHGDTRDKGLVEGTNKKIALLIAVIALFLAFSETLGKSAQTAGIGYNVEASNLWAFFQAKTIRRTLVETAAQEMTVAVTGETNEQAKAARAKQIDFWQKTAQRYRSEPETREGSVELMARAKEAEEKRDTALTIPPVRGGIGRLPDRHRAGLRGRDHGNDRARLSRRRARIGRSLRSPASRFSHRTRCICSDL